MRYHATRPPLLPIWRSTRHSAKKWPTDKTLGGGPRSRSPRRSARDLEFMRDQLHAPIAFDRRRRGYCYTEPTYQLDLHAVTQGELVACWFAERMMRQFRGNAVRARTCGRRLTNCARCFPTRFGQGSKRWPTSCRCWPDGVAIRPENVLFHISSAVVCRQRLDCCTGRRAGTRGPMCPG